MSMAEDFWTIRASNPDASSSPNWAEMASRMADLGYWRLDVATGALAWSDALFDLYGLDRARGPDPKGMLATVHASDHAYSIKCLKRAVDFGEDYALQFRLRRDDGSWRTLRNHTVCDRGPTGAVAVVRGVVMDVTESEACRVHTEHGNDVIVLTDLEGRITYISPSLELLSGHRPEEHVGMTMAEIGGAEISAALEGALREALTHPGGWARSVEYGLRHKDGRALRVESHPRLLMDPISGRHIGFTDVVRDITERKAAEEKLEHANTVLRAQIDASPVAIMLVEPGRETSTFNRTFALMWGIPLTEMADRPHGDIYEHCLAQVKDRAQFVDRVNHLNQNTRENSVDTLEMIDGRSIDRYGAGVHTPAGVYVGRVWFFRDVTEHKHALAEALRMARFDGLTGLANRDVFVEAVKHASATAKRGGQFAVLYLDLDHFKDINDTLGHSVGDDLLKAVAGRLRSHARETDIVARLGGDEFAIIAEDVSDPAAAIVLADTLIAAINAPFQIGDREIRTGVSIGMEVYGRDAADFETLLAHADLALHRAKAEGRGCGRFFTQAMDTAARTRVALADEIRDAIRSDELFLMYQPQVSLENGRITGLEALVRWRHPSRGVLGPNLFIPVAEDMGLIDELGHWVLWAACRQARIWLDAGAAPFRLCVNVSALQFKAPRAFEADVMAALEEARMPPEMLELELTESVLMGASREHGEVLPRLAKAGVMIAIDDFGTGYSSLDYLRRFPTDRIKIDQTFVRHLKATGGDAVIVKATIGLARELGIMAIAEGVETLEQRNLLIGWGCAEAQGYYFARPLEAGDVVALLRPGGPLLPRNPDVIALG